ncbi:hypothetical protein EE612_043705 [Oryza sativa]|jgi:hypothetical protein|nr:hypothetical protein EE612_043705 [Oryza sativa]
MAAVPCGESFPCAAILRLRLRRYWSGRNMDLLVLSASDVTPSPPQTSPASLIPSRSSLLSHAGQHTEVSPSTPSAARAAITSKRMQATSQIVFAVGFASHRRAWLPSPGVMHNMSPSMMVGSHACSVVSSLVNNF